VLEKIKTLLGSIRFWVVTLAWLSLYLGIVEKNGFNTAELLNQVAIWLGTVAGIGTLDSVAEKLFVTKK
jgi:hypothetical protein